MRSDRASRASESVARPARSRQLQATAEACGRVSIDASDIFLDCRGRGAGPEAGEDKRNQGRVARASVPPPNPSPLSPLPPPSPRPGEGDPAGAVFVFSLFFP